MGKNKQVKSKARDTPQEPLIQLSEEEQWRIVNQSGILSKVKVPDTSPSSPKEDVPLAEEILDACLYIIPFSFLLLMMEILIHYQYGRHPTLADLTNRMISGVPILSVFIFYTIRHKRHRRTQFLLFILSCLVGSRMIYMLNRSSWLVNMKQCPPLATVWVYTIVQLDLGPAVLNLFVVGAFVWWKGLRILSLR